MEKSDITTALQGIDKNYTDILLSDDNIQFLNTALRTINSVLPRGKKILPHPHNMFAAFRYTPIDELKVVIIGQDPFQTVGMADGMAFSCANAKIPPSSENIFKALASQKLIPGMPKSGNLKSWANQGVLLLNTALTTEEGVSGAHIEIWKPYMTGVIKELSTKYTKLIFMLWGAKSNEFAHCINSSREHVILTWGHPSPVSRFNNNITDNRHFIHCDNFSQANKLLLDMEKMPIRWETVCTDVAGNASPSKELSKEPSKELSKEPSKESSALSKISLPTDLSVYSVICGIDGAAVNINKPNAFASWAYAIILQENIKTIRSDNPDVIIEYGTLNKGKDSTNNRGELTALLKLLERVQEESFGNRICVFTDSMIVYYAVNNYEKWITDGVINSKCNIDIVSSIHEILNELKMQNIHMDLYHVYGHQSVLASYKDTDYIPVYLNNIADHYTQKALSS